MMQHLTAFLAIFKQLLQTQALTCQEWLNWHMPVHTGSHRLGPTPTCPDSKILFLHHNLKTSVFFFNEHKYFNLESGQVVAGVSRYE